MSVCDQQLDCRDLDDKAASQISDRISVISADANSEVMPRRSRSRATIAGPHRGSVFSARAGGCAFMSGGTISAVEKLEHDRSFPSR